MNQTTQNIYIEWPLLTEFSGNAARLVDIDFELIFGKSKSLNFLSKWPDFCTKIIPVFEEDVKDKTMKKKLEKLKESISEGNLICACRYITILTNNSQNRIVYLF